MATGQGRLEIEVDGDVAIVRFADKTIVDEQIILQMGNQLLTLIEEGACKKLILDFVRVDIVNSSALGMLFKVGRKAKEINVKLRLCCLGRDISDVFEITKLNTFFDCKPTVAEAMKDF